MSELQAESGAAVQASEQLQRQRANALATLETLKVRWGGTTGQNFDAAVARCQ